MAARARRQPRKRGRGPAPRAGSSFTASGGGGSGATSGRKCAGEAAGGRSRQHVRQRRLRAGPEGEGRPGCGRLPGGPAAPPHVLAARGPQDRPASLGPPLPSPPRGLAAALPEEHGPVGAAPLRAGFPESQGACFASLPSGSAGSVLSDGGFVHVSSCQASAHPPHGGAVPFCRCNTSRSMYTI